MTRSDGDSYRTQLQEVRTYINKARESDNEVESTVALVLALDLLVDLVEVLAAQVGGEVPKDPWDYDP